MLWCSCTRVVPSASTDGRADVGHKLLAAGSRQSVQMMEMGTRGRRRRGFAHSPVRAERVEDLHRGGNPGERRDRQHRGLVHLQVAHGQGLVSA
jgi:hypothetical protein